MSCHLIVFFQLPVDVQSDRSSWAHTAETWTRVVSYLIVSLVHWEVSTWRSALGFLCPPPWLVSLLPVTLHCWRWPVADADQWLFGAGGTLWVPWVGLLLFCIGPSQSWHHSVAFSLAFFPSMSVQASPRLTIPCLVTALASLLWWSSHRPVPLHTLCPILLASLITVSYPRCLFVASALQVNLWEQSPGICGLVL